MYPDQVICFEPLSESFVFGIFKKNPSLSDFTHKHVTGE
jgi:hypothetical protein